MKDWANTFEILRQYLTKVIITSALLYWSVGDHSSWDSRQQCTLYLAQWTDQPCSVSSVSDWYWTTVGWSACYQSLWSLLPCVFKLLGDSFLKPQTALSLFVKFLLKTWWILYVSSWVMLYQQVSTSGTSLGSLVSSHALCVLCRSVGWAELSWADPSDAPLLPILCRYPQLGQWPPWWAPKRLVSQSCW